MRIVCVDPGQTCGIAELYVPKGDSPAVLTAFCEIPSKPEAIHKFWLGRDIDFDLMVVETWEYRHGTPTDARHACEPLGVFKYLAWLGDVPVIEQRPGFRVSVPDDKKFLDPMGYWIPGYKGSKGALEGHARQAERHGLAYLMHTAKHGPTQRHLLTGV